MTYALNDPAHIELGHNELVAAIQEQADRFMVTVTLPDTAGLGDTGHVADHNLIVAALQAIADAPTGPDPAAVSGTTGSPATGTFVAGGTTYNYWRWTGNGDVTFSTAGAVKCLVVGGGGGSGSRGGGGGGGYVATDLTVLAGTYPVTVGAGGTGAADTASNGGDSRFGSITALGGGGGGGTSRGGLAGGSGGGSGQVFATYPGAAALTTYGPQGNAGGDRTGGGGGGGAGGAASAGTGGVGRTWDNGTTYGAGGLSDGGAPATPTANSGNGAKDYNTNGAAGVVILAIEA